MKRTRTGDETFVKIRYIRRYISTPIHEESDDEDNDTNGKLICEHSDSTFYVRVIPDQDWNPPAYRYCYLDHIKQTGEISMQIYADLEITGYKELTRRGDGDRDVCIWFIVKL
jgi:hypothetical protein